MLCSNYTDPGRSKLKAIKINPLTTAVPGTATVDDIKASLQSIRFLGLTPSSQGGSTHSLDSKQASPYYYNLETTMLYKSLYS